MPQSRCPGAYRWRPWPWTGRRTPPCWPSRGSPSPTTAWPSGWPTSGRSGTSERPTGASQCDRLVHHRSDGEPVSNLVDLPLRHFASGKVRDIYEVDDKHLLFVTSDRMSAFDVVMAELIPDKGRVLTAVTAFWLDRLEGIAANHLTSLDVPSSMELDEATARDLTGRVMVVRRA